MFVCQRIHIFVSCDFTHVNSLEVAYVFSLTNAQSNRNSTSYRSYRN